MEAKFFYVSVIDGNRRALVAGPYDDHADALERVDAVKTLAENRYADISRKGPWLAWGTAGSESALNTPMGIV